MITYNQLITLINDNVVANGNNEITADVLRPVLIAMAQQINELVGDPNNFPNNEETVEDALNYLDNKTAGVTIHEGTDNPNDVPPASYVQGDFYNQVNGSSVTIDYWVFTGVNWVQLLSRDEQKLRNYTDINTNYTVKSDDDIVVFNGVSSSTLITLPDPVTNLNKIYTICNISVVNTNISTYRDLDKNNQSIFTPATVLRLMSDGTVWQQINN